MRYWDSSAIVPLLIREPSSSWAAKLYESDPELTVWWGSALECVSVVTRHERTGGLRVEHARLALARLDEFAAAWQQVEPSAQIGDGARRAIRSHALRAADALQLAGAIRAAEGDPQSLPFVSLDAALREAAEREGFRVVEPQQAV